MTVISPENWKRLVEANRSAVDAGWAAPGVFSTGIGPDYRSGGLLYVGKSAGPLGNQVGSCHDQSASSDASTRWMVERRNLSAFWQFVDRIDSTRRSIAWTNVCKMDVRGGGRPPSGRAWLSISGPCLAALNDELTQLAPKVTVFAISDAFLGEVKSRLLFMGYTPDLSRTIGDGCTETYCNSAGQFALTTRHPQGWANSYRDRVIAEVRSMMS